MKKTKKLWKGLILIGLVGTIGFACQDDSIEEVTTIDDPLMEVAELSSQLSTGMDLAFANGKGQRPEGTSFGSRPQGFGGGRPGAGFGGGQTMRFQQYNDDPNLQVISIADRIGEKLNFWMFEKLGADVIHYDEGGAILEITERPERGAWKNGDGPKIAQTVIDFGDGFLLERGDVKLNITGAITIDRSYSDNQLSEIISLQNFKLNDATIEGTKSSIKSFNAENGEGQMSLAVSGGKFTFSDGTTADWVSSKSRNISIEIPDGGGRPSSGSATSESETVVTSADGTLVYSHKTTSPVVMDVSCMGRGKGRKPASGTIEGIYGENTIEVDFGNGDCTNSITVTVNGETVSREIGG